MDYNLFFEKLKSAVKAEREEQKENLALGYGRENYENFIGRLAGMDEVVRMGEKIIRDFHNGAE